MADLAVFVRDPTTNALVLGVPRPPRTVSGIEKLVQIVALALLSSGTRSLEPHRAGGLRALVGAQVDFDDPAELLADVRLVIARVEQMIKEEQALTARPPSERLAMLEIVDIVPDDRSLAVEIVLAVLNEEQRLAQAALSVP